jgi:hypothetical protein
MKLTLTLAGDDVVIAQAAAHGPDGMRGDMELQIRPGEVVAGIPYHVWRRHVGSTAALEDLRCEVDAE